MNNMFIWFQVSLTIRTNKLPLGLLGGDKVFVTVRCLIHGSNLQKPAKILLLFVALQLQDCVPLVNPGVSHLCIRGDGKLLSSAGWDHRVRIFGWKKLRPLAVLQYHTDMVLSVAFSDHQDPRQRLLAAGSKDHRISLWSIYNEGADTG